MLLGTSGCGKSSFINYLAQEEVAKVSDNGESCTEEVKCYEVVVLEKKLRLFDTQGYNDTKGEMNETVASKIRNAFA